MTKNTSSVKDLRALTEKQLSEQVTVSKLHMQSLRSKLAIGKLKSMQDIDKERKQVARLLTVLNEKAMLKEVADGN